jgi:hypothetical protein
MPRKPKIPKVTYRYAGKDDKALNAVFDMPFEKLEHEVAQKQAAKAIKTSKSPDKAA